VKFLFDELVEDLGVGLNLNNNLDDLIPVSQRGVVMTTVVATTTTITTAKQQQQQQQLQQQHQRPYETIQQVHIRFGIGLPGFRQRQKLSMIN